MSLQRALEWLRDPLRDIAGLLSIVSGFIFQFEGVQLRRLARQSSRAIHCLVELSDGWAVGDSLGGVSVYDTEAEHCLYVVQQAYAVYTIAPLDHNGFASNAEFGLWVVHDSTRTPSVPNRRFVHRTKSRPADEKHCILKLVSYPSGLVVSSTKSGPLLHVWDTKLEGADFNVRTLVGRGVVADLTASGDQLVSVHKTIMDRTNEFETTACIWDVQNGVHLQTIELDVRYFKSFIALNEDTLVVFDFGGCHVFDTKTGIKRFERKCVVTSWVNYDSQILCSFFHNGLALLDVDDGTLQNCSPDQIEALTPSRVDRLLYLRSGRIVVCKDGNLYVWK
jgi:hypothetical protein